MELVILGLVVLFLYVFIRALSTFSAWLTGQRYRAYRNLATLHRGRYESRGLSDPPTVSFLHNGSTVRVGLAPTIAGQPGQIPPDAGRRAVRQGDSVPPRAGPDLPARSAAAAAGDPAGPGPRPGRSTARTSSRPTITRWPATSWSSPSADSVENLQRMVHPGGMLVSINPERLLVQVNRNLGQSSEALALAVREALVIHDGLLEGVHRRMSQGIAIMDRAGLLGGGRRARPSARSAASRSPPAPSSSAPPAIPRIIATAGSTSVPARSTAATARSA